MERLVVLSNDIVPYHQWVFAECAYVSDEKEPGREDASSLHRIGKSLHNTLRCFCCCCCIGRLTVCVKTAVVFGLHEGLKCCYSTRKYEIQFNILKLAKAWLQKYKRLQKKCERKVRKTRPVSHIGQQKFFAVVDSWGT